MIATARAAVVDTSALEALTFRLVSAGSVLELSLVLQARHGATADIIEDEIIRDLRLDVAPFDITQLVLARDGARRFGNGRHAASLNSGDLYAYALAMDRQLPLLFVGDDFPRTDVARLSA